MDTLQDLMRHLADLLRAIGRDGLFHLFIGVLGGLASMATLYDVARRAAGDCRHARRERDGEKDE